MRGTYRVGGPFGKPLANPGRNTEVIARARVEIEAMRMMAPKAAEAMDGLGNREARVWVSASDCVAARVLPWYWTTMALAASKLTAQGQISVPAEVRRKLGVGPGSMIEWDEDGEQIVVRRAGHTTFEEIHRAVFPGRPPKRRTVAEMDAGIASYMRKKHGRRARG